MRPCSRNICLTLILAICAETSNSLASRVGKIGADRLFHAGKRRSPPREMIRRIAQRLPPAPNCVESIADSSEIIRHACGCILDFSPMPKVHVQEQGGPSLALSDS